MSVGVGERIRSRREMLGMSISDLAKRAGLSRGTIYRYETSGSEKMTVGNLYKLCMALGTSVGGILGDVEAKSVEGDREGRESTLQGALRVYGVDSQINQLKEEAAELIVALSHWERTFEEGKAEVYDAVLEEIVDLQIMLDQMKYAFDWTGEDLGRIERYKLKRLGDRLEKACL